MVHLFSQHIFFAYTDHHIMMPLQPEEGAFSVGMCLMSGRATLTVYFARIYATYFVSFILQYVGFSKTFIEKKWKSMVQWLGFLLQRGGW